MLILARGPRFRALDNFGPRVTIHGKAPRLRARGDRRESAMFHKNKKKPEAGVPAPDAVEIPDLKKRQEEKKKRGGAPPPWWSKSAADSAIAAGQAGSGGGSGLFGLGRLAAYLAGASGMKALLLFGGGLAVAGALLFGGATLLQLLGLRTGSPSPGAMSPSLGGIGPSGIVVDRPKNRSLDYMARAGQGELRFDQDVGSVAGEGVSLEEGKEEPSPPEEPAPEAAQAGASGGLDALRERFIHKLTKDVGELHSGQMASARLKPGLGNFQLKTSIGNLPKINQGRLSETSRQKTPKSSRKISVLRGKTNRAFGQLRLSRVMSQQGAASIGEESPRSYAADAFDQGKTDGAPLPNPSGVTPTTPGPIVVPPGAGAPGVDTLPIPPGLPPGVNVTPYQPSLNLAGGLADMAGMLKMIGTMLMVIGALLIAAGLFLLGAGPWAIAAGIALIAAGAAMLMLGQQMMSQSASMADQAKQIGESLKQTSNQTDQGQIVQECTDQALAGTKTKDCKPQTQPQVQRGTAQEDVKKERDSTFTLENGKQP